VSKLFICGSGVKITKRHLNLATEFATSKSDGVSCMKCDVGTLSDIYAKADQYCQAEDCFVDDME